MRGSRLPRGRIRNKMRVEKIEIKCLGKMYVRILPLIFKVRIVKRNDKRMNLQDVRILDIVESIYNLVVINFYFDVKI